MFQWLDLLFSEIRTKWAYCCVYVVVVVVVVALAAHLGADKCQMTAP